METTTDIIVGYILGLNMGYELLHYYNDKGKENGNHYIICGNAGHFCLWGL